MSADRDYKVGRKNQWRRELWNAITDRLHVPAREALVLYLAGPDDLDRPLALARGFKPLNLIAVDRDAETVTRLRRSGALCVRGDMVDVVLSWPSDKPLGVILGDFCSGLEKRLWELAAYTALMPQFWDAVIAVNLQRGRDSTGTHLRAQWSELYGHSALGKTKHRGLLFAGEFAAWAFAIGKGLVAGDSDGLYMKDGGGDPNDEQFSLCVQATRPHFMSYRSGDALTFDSAVLRAPLPPEFKRERKTEIAGTKHLKATRHIAAVLAHRTMRIKATVNRSLH